MLVLTNKEDCGTSIEIMSENRRRFLGRAGLLGVAGMGMFFAGKSVAAENEMEFGTVKETVPCLNVRDFGAKGDGKTADSEAIQKALDMAGTIRGRVYFPPGRYLCHDLKVKEQTVLEAAPGWEYRQDCGTALVLDSDNAECVLNLTGAFGAHLYGLYLEGRPNIEKPIYGIFMNNENFDSRENAVVIDDCKVKGFSGHGVWLRKVWLFIIRHSLFHSNRGCGVAVQGWDGFVTDNQFSGNKGDGFGTIEYCSTVMFTANRVEWNGGYGLSILNGDTWNVTGNCLDRNWGAGVYAMNVRAATLTGNLFRRCGKDSHQLGEGEVSCHLRIENCAGMSVTGNAFRAGQDDGGKGKFTPQVGFILKGLSCSIISSNVLHQGYMDKMQVDQGGHGEDFIFKDNVGSPMKK